MTGPNDGRADAMSTPDSPSWEDTPAFREIFLAHFPPEAAEAFRQAGRHLYDAVLEVDLYELAGSSFRPVAVKPVETRT